MTIDAHVHLWREGGGHEVWIRRKIAGIDRDFAPADLRRAGAAATFSAPVLVHATEDPAETPHLLRLAEAEPLVAAAIGWADLDDPGLPRRLAASWRVRRSSAACEPSRPSERPIACSIRPRSATCANSRGVGWCWTCWPRRRSCAC